jgi:hypothetical protein
MIAHNGDKLCNMIYLDDDNKENITRFVLTTLVVICIDCTSMCKSNYHTITATMAPAKLKVLLEIFHTWSYWCHWLFQVSVMVTFSKVLLDIFQWRLCVPEGVYCTLWEDFFRFSGVIFRFFGSLPIYCILVVCILHSVVTWYECCIPKKVSVICNTW